MKVLKGKEKEEYETFISTIDFKKIEIDQNLKAPDDFEIIRPYDFETKTRKKYD
jgi:hypothetical protein